ncbi:MAG: hypothetical protein AzoDbin1_03224 [Azoarcus sp.]|uniref:DUF1840 domain-containing protein n=1 Tax=Aromatoleum tolulyticum TaxID=34027 RepID=A0A1N6NCF0_9RHOO|nr:DUF1840 domain-containing protein [Aromatoleum tolulyticum]MCK9986752.1 hypothetical protein [Azoarcus sp.]SIP89730.1 protein of unknown function [Aromatoleum tolulyticum]
MLITFKSAAGADVIMFGDIAKKLVAILGKDPQDGKGIVTVEQLPDAIARLRAAIEEDKARRAGQAQDDDEEPDPERRGMAAPVSLAQRAWPLLDLLEASQKEGVPVVWGV